MISTTSKENSDNFTKSKNGTYIKFIINITKNNMKQKDNNVGEQNNYFRKEKITNMNTFFGVEEEKDITDTPANLLIKNEKEIIKQKITESLKNVNVTSFEIQSYICKFYRDRVVHEKTIVDDLQDAIYKKYPNLDPNQSVLIPIYFKAPFFDNILWLRMPAFIMKTHVTKLESQIQKIAADWICRDRSNAIENEFQSKANTTIPSAVLKKKSWIEKFNKDWMNVTSRLSFGYSPYFYLLEYSYIYSNTLYIKDKKQKGLIGIILMYCKHNKDGKIILQDFATIHLSANQKNTSYEDFEKLLNENLRANIYYYASQNTYVENLFYNNILPWSGLLLERNHHLINFLPLLYFNTEAIKKGKQLCLERKDHYKACVLCNGINLLLNLGSSMYQAKWRNAYSNLPIKYNYYDIQLIQKPYYRVCGESTFMYRPWQQTYVGDFDEARISSCDCW